MPTLIHNIGTLQTPLGSFPHAGAAQGENRKYHNAAVLCEGGVIKAVYEIGALPGYPNHRCAGPPCYARAYRRAYPPGFRRLAAKRNSVKA